MKTALIFFCTCVNTRSRCTGNPGSAVISTDAAGKITFFGVTSKFTENFNLTLLTQKYKAVKVSFNGLITPLLKTTDKNSTPFCVATLIANIYYFLSRTEFVSFILSTPIVTHFSVFIRIQ